MLTLNLLHKATILYVEPDLPFEVKRIKPQHPFLSNPLQR